MLQKIVTFIFICLIFQLPANAQVGNTPSEIDPCDDIAQFSVTIPNGNIDQSSTLGAGTADKAVDGDFSDESTARSKETMNAWLDLDLGEIYSLNNLQIHYPDGEGMSKYYILYSDEPFSSDNLGVEISNQSVNHVFIYSLASGAEIPLGGENIRYLRIQLADKGRIVVTEVVLFAGPNDDNVEDCSNGIDDDCDGLIDCEDPDCSGWINEDASVQINPTCSICEDGEIHIYGQANDTNITEYSIDNGQTWQDSRFFYNLDEGDYYAWIKNPITECWKEFEGNPIELRSPPGDPNGSSHCPNGGFEDGDFTGWTGGLGTYSGPNSFGNNPTLVIDNDDFDDFTLGAASRHRIIQSSTDSDPNIPQIILSPPGGGTYFAKLGTDIFPPWSKAQRLTYCFVVDDENKDFYFNFAIVLQDPDDHDSQEKPFFRYKMFTPGNSANSFFEEKFNSTNDGFFNEHGDFLYRNWTCRNLDLSNRVGQEVCIKFVTTDCSLAGNHSGYAYIDGLCSSADVQIPTNNLSINPTICPGSDNFLIEASAINANKYTWEVCQINPNGFEFACESKDFEGDILPFDIREFYENEHGSFTCDRRYRVRLTASNECFDGDTVEEDVFVACPRDIDYEDITYCVNSGEPTPVVGTNDCTNCSYEWVATDDEDPIAFDNPNAAFPNIINFPPGTFTSRTVAVTVTDNQTGCVYSDEVTVSRFIHKPQVSISFDDTYLCPESNPTDCQLLFFAEITTPIAFGDLEISLLNESNGTIFTEFDLTSTSVLEDYPVTVNQYRIRYILDGLDAGVTDESTYTITVDLEDFEGENSGGCEAEAQVVVGDLPFWGNIPAMFFPNSFTPNDDGTNDLWIPFPITGNDYNSSWYKLQILGQNGGLFYESEDCAPTGGFNLGDISWDGNNDDGQAVNTGVFVFLVQFENCNNKRSSGNFGDCSAPVCFSGDVLVLQ